MRDVGIEPVLKGRVGFPPQVPFAEVSGDITGFVDDLSQRGVLGVQPRYALGRSYFLICASIWRENLFKNDRRGVASGAREACPSRILPAHDAAAGGRAQRVRGVRVGKQHATLGQSLDIRRLVEAGRAVQRRVAPAEIIGEDEYDIHLLFKVFIRCQVGGYDIDACCRQKNEGKEVFHCQITSFWQLK